MRRALPLAVVLFSLTSLGASAPKPAPFSEEDKGVGFSDIAFAAAGTFISSADGTVRRLEGDRLPVAFDAGRKLVGMAVSEDGKQLAAVGAGVVARSADGGRTFRIEPTPDSVMVYAVAFSRGELLIFDVKGRGFRSPRLGASFQPIALPRATRFWTASFSGLRGFVVGQDGVLLATEDGGRSWQLLTAPSKESEGVLAVGDRVWVSGQEGVFLSGDGGRHFRQVFTSSKTCTRMGARGRAVVAACSLLNHALLYSEDGERFQEVDVPDAANLVAAGITSDGQLLAVGSYEVLVRASSKSGRIIAHSPNVRTWLEVAAQLRAQEKGGSLQPASPQDPELPKGVTWREGQRGVLTVTVRNRREAPLAGVVVELVETQAIHGERGAQKARTGADGRYRFDVLRFRGVRVSVNAPEYAPFSQEFRLNPWGETNLEILLQDAVRPENP